MFGLVKVKNKFGALEYCEIPEPQLENESSVKIKIITAGICGSDLEIYKDFIKVNTPVVIGHEFFGLVTQTGSNVKKIKIGDRVTSESIVWTCGRCVYCLKGHYSLCSERKAIGYQVNGAFAEYIVVPEEKVFKLPEEISPEHASFLEPLSCCVHGILENNLQFPKGLVIISGPGTIGLLSLQIANLSNCEVILLGISKDINRLKIAKSLGASYAINVEDPDDIELLKKISKERQIDAAINCSGSEKSINKLIELLKNEGTLLQLGVFKNKINIDLNRMLFKEITFINSISHILSSWGKSIKIIKDGLIKIDPLISGIFKLSDWERAFKSAEDGLGVKVLFRIGECP